LQFRSEKIDTFEVTSKARALKVAEDYAIRLMRLNYSEVVARSIARSLVERYSEHGFTIDRDEAGTDSAGRASIFHLGLKIAKLSSEVEGIFTRLTPYLEQQGPIVGRIVEASSWPSGNQLLLRRG
jgi:hypothetical protein